LKPSDSEPGKPIARGLGTTKKHAEQDAARRALARLKASRTAAARNPKAEEEQAAK
jgi:ribonuclease-3